LKYNGYKVKHVMNITDVGHLTSDADEGEDKMEKGAKRENKTAWEIAEFYTQAFKSNLHDLNIIKPDIWCKATDHIKEQIKLVQKLIDKGFTYETSDGIYFDTTKIDDYGKMANLKNQELKAGERVEMGEKRNQHDFALWKWSSRHSEQPKGSSRQMEWSAFGHMGFPGWHIECSAMSMKYLGEQFDIHCGGIDHIPVHHTNEIAQSESVTGKKPWVKYWMHGEFLVLEKAETRTTNCPKCQRPYRLGTGVEEEQIINNYNTGKVRLICPKCKEKFQVELSKMSKSGQNFITMSHLNEKNINPLSYRYLLLQTHYRKQLTFSWEALEAADSGLKHLYDEVRKLKKENAKRNCEEIKKKFKEEINDDLNTPSALALIWDALKNNAIDYKTLLEFDKVLGLEFKKTEKLKNLKTDVPDEVQKLLDARATARAQKNWAESDRLRDEVRKLGFGVEDTKDGQILTDINIRQYLLIFVNIWN